MSLRDDFEQWLADVYSTQPDFSEDVNGNYCDAQVDAAWRAYKAGTERAVRIAEEEIAARPKYFRVIEAIDRILKRLKDES